MKQVELLIIGGGPSGMAAAISAAEQGCKVLLVDRNSRLGGQLIKQTHMFFGSKEQYASVRGFDIANKFIKKLNSLKNIEILTDTTILGIYEDKVVTAESSGKYIKIKPRAIIIATGAYEKTFVFPNNDLPGIYGAGAVQTLMNVYGVKPGNDILMIGAGNIGLIVSYQLLQAGINVKAIVEAAPSIGGYLVHAAKIRRMGIPIYTSYTVKKAYGEKSLEKVTIWKLNSKGKPIEDTEIDFKVDIMCISVGLTPLSELLWQSGCKMKYIPQLGGFVPIRDRYLKTTVEGIFTAGDVAAVEEASSAMVEGYLSGLSALRFLGYDNYKIIYLQNKYITQLESLRSGPKGEKIKKGIILAEQF